jgi:hypothetical protein
MNGVAIFVRFGEKVLVGEFEVLRRISRRFPQARRKAYYFMSIHEHLPADATRKGRK